MKYLSPKDRINYIGRPHHYCAHTTGEDYSVIRVHTHTGAAQPKLVAALVSNVVLIVST
jgi:hypothetical protein